MMFQKVDLPHTQKEYNIFAGLLLFLLLLIFTTVVRANPVDNLAPGHWYKVPHSKMIQVAPKPSPPGIVGPSAVVSKWSGGAFDTTRHRMIVWGGGHADYSGNEVYVFDVNTLKWQRLTDPSRDVGGDIKTGLYPDGRPRSAHSYNSLQYLPNIDRLAVFGLSATYRKSGGSSKLFTFNFDTDHWSHKRAPIPKDAGGYDHLTAYDPKTGKVWVHGSSHGGFYSYDSQTDHWSPRFGGSYITIYPTAAIDPEKHIMVAVGGGAYEPKSQAILWNLDKPGKRVDLRSRTSGPKTIQGAKAPGFVFDPKIHMFVAWSGGGDVYLLNPEDWSWHRIPPAPGNAVLPSNAQPEGTYGRFRYVPSKNAFILVNSAKKDVYFYKLPSDPVATSAAAVANNPKQNVRADAFALTSPARESTSMRPTQSTQSVKPVRQGKPNFGKTGEVTNFAVISESNDVQHKVPVTFGQVFRPGAVGTNQQLEARLADGHVVPLQVDRKKLNDDGSLRFAVLTAMLPKLAARHVDQLKLVTSANADPAPASGAGSPGRAALLAKGFSAEAVIDWQGSQYRVSAASLLKVGKAKMWLDGPIAREWVVRGIPTDASGHEQPNLGVEFTIRAYAGLHRVRVGVAIDNDWAYDAAPDNLTYDIQLKVDGKTVYQKQHLTQYAHTRWHGVFWWGNQPSAEVWLNTAYIQSTGAVPQYAPLQPSPKRLNHMLASWSPMGHGSISTYMPATGADPDIGLLPRWSALYLVSGDLRAKRAVILNGEAGGSYSIHYQIKNTGLPLSIKNHPYVSIIGNRNDMVNPKTHKSDAMPKCAHKCKSPYVAESSHMPSIAYIPYLITGDYYFLQEVEQWANWHEVWMNPNYRHLGDGMLFPHGQVRGQAWALRELGYAAYIAPTDDPLADYFYQIVRSNLQYLQKHYVDNSDANKLHFVSDWGAVIYRKRSGIAPWQQDFFNSTLGQLTRLDFKQAQAPLKWFSAFPVDRMIAPGFCWISAAMYSMQVRNSQHAPFYETFKQAYDQSVKPSVRTAACNSRAMAKALHLPSTDVMTGYPSEPAGFPADLQPALSVAVDAGAPGAREAWKKFMSRKMKPNYADYPNFAIVPSRVDHGR